MLPRSDCERQTRRFLNGIQNGLKDHAAGTAMTGHGAMPATFTATDPAM